MAVQGVLRLRTEVVVNSADDPIAISVPITGSLPPRSYVLDTGPEWALHFLQVRYRQAVCRKLTWAVNAGFELTSNSTVKLSICPWTDFPMVLVKHV